MKKILLVEDDTKIQLVLSTRLKAEGYEVVIADDAVIAQSKAVSERPDLTILDISMPGGNGFTVADRLQSHAATAGVPMIFITASSLPELRHLAAKRNAVAYFEKPFEPDDLVASITSTIGEAA